MAEPDQPIRLLDPARCHPATRLASVFVKICGVATEDDALLCAGLGVDAVGIVFAASSRRVSRGVAIDIVRRLPPEILTIGVFRNESRERVVETANRVGLRGVQLHGMESPEDTAWVAARVPMVIRAFAAGDPAIDHLSDYGGVQLLIDSAQPGSGKSFDWKKLADNRPAAPFILAGGLGPDNVAEAISALHPAGVDVSSGVEARPGIKDPVRVGQFIRRARRAAKQSKGERPYDWEEDA